MLVSFSLAVFFETPELQFFLFFNIFNHLSTFFFVLFWFLLFRCFTIFTSLNYLTIYSVLLSCFSSSSYSDTASSINSLCDSFSDVLTSFSLLLPSTIGFSVCSSPICMFLVSECSLLYLQVGLTLLLAFQVSRHC